MGSISLYEAISLKGNKIYENLFEAFPRYILNLNPDLYHILWNGKYTRETHLWKV